VIGERTPLARSFWRPAENFVRLTLRAERQSLLAAAMSRKLAVDCNLTDAQTGR
jgi:hypothetical protein